MLIFISYSRKAHSDNQKNNIRQQSGLLLEDCNLQQKIDRLSCFTKYQDPREYETFKFAVKYENMTFIGIGNA